ncbi:MAG: hypothetical protein ACI957_005219, partial [Verrucomicrobiales bacterium]
MLEFEACFTRCISESFDLAVVEMTTTIKENGTHIGSNGALADDFANLDC